MPVEALVDTGSPWIAIAPRDILKLSIPIKSLQKATHFPEVSLAGHKFWRFLLRDVSVNIKDEKGRIIKINLSSISALWPTKKKWPDEIKHIPSVLGSDFLTTTKFALYFNPSKQMAYLERGP